MFLSYLPEFRAKSESSVRPLPRSFRVRSLRDFVSSPPKELLLCPVWALQVYLSRTSSLPSRPRSLFVSPRNPSRPLSFFIRNVISSSSSSAPSSSRPSTPSSSVSLRSSRSASSFRAHGVRGVAASWAFLRKAPLSVILEVATWNSSKVFTSFYLKGSAERGVLVIFRKSFLLHF